MDPVYKSKKALQNLARVFSRAEVKDSVERRLKWILQICMLVEKYIISQCIA